jgi:hypothetical protein
MHKNKREARKLPGENTIRLTGGEGDKCQNILLYAKQEANTGSVVPDASFCHSATFSL